MRDVDVGSCYEALGPKLSKSIIGFYVFSVCDQIGRFFIQSKLTRGSLRFYVNSDDFAVVAFLKLLVDGNFPSLETLEAH